MATTLSVVATASAAAPPPPLTGESLGNRGSSGTAVGSCNPDATSSLRWDVSGAASGFYDEPGPYPGTFETDGRASFGPLVAGVEGIKAAPLNSYRARFTIDSPVGQVTGTLRLVPIRRKERRAASASPTRTTSV